MVPTMYYSRRGGTRPIFYSFVTSGDEMNILSCMLAKMGAIHTITRSVIPQYTQSCWFYMRDELGLNMSINPNLGH